MIGVLLVAVVVLAGVGLWMGWIYTIERNRNQVLAGRVGRLAGALWWMRQEYRYAVPNFEAYTRADAVLKQVDTVLRAEWDDHYERGLLDKEVEDHG